MKNKIDQIDSWFHQILEDNLFIIGMAGLLIISFLIRMHLAPICVLSADYNNTLVSWVDAYREIGIVKGLSQQIGDYYIPYNLLLAFASLFPVEPWVFIAGTSILAEYITGYFIYKILKEYLACSKKKAAIIGVISLLLPAVMMNGALWKQCDSIYTCFMIISIYYVLKERCGRALFFFSIGFVFKIQALFIFPLLVFIYLFRKKGISFIHFFWVPALYFLAGLPAVFAGRRITNVYGTYYRQIGHKGYDGMTINFPNVYSFGLTDYPALSMPATIFTIAIFIAAACILIKYKDNITDSLIVLLGIWSIWTCVMLLPSMHERYDYSYIILLTVFYLATDIKKIWTAVIINIISCSLYGMYLFNAEPMSFPVMAAFNVAAYLYVSYDLYRLMKNSRLEYEKRRI